MKALLLAAGMATRLYPLTLDRPKALVPFLDRPLIEWQLEAVGALSLDGIAVNVHHCTNRMAGYLESKEGLTISLEERLLGTAGCLVPLTDFLGDDTFLLANTDIVHRLPLARALELHRRRAATATLIAVEGAVGEFDLLGLDGADRVIGLPGLQLPGRPVSTVVYSGMAILTPRVIEYLPPGDSAFSQLLTALLTAGEPVCAAVLPGYWREVGSLDRYLLAQLEMLSGAGGLGAPGHRRAPGIWAGGPVTVDDGALLEPPLFLGAGTRVRTGARVGPSVVVGEQVDIGQGVVVKESVVWEGVSLPAGARVDRCIVAVSPPDEEFVDWQGMAVAAGGRSEIGGMLHRYAQ